MYNYNFKKNDESLLKEFKNILIEVEGHQKIVNIIITEKNILFFYDSSTGNILKKYPSLQFPAEYELIGTIPIVEAKIDFDFEENITKAKYMDKTIIICGIDLRDYLKTL